MAWWFFAIIGALAIGIQALVARKILLTHGLLTFACAWHLLTSVLYLPLALGHFLTVSVHALPILVPALMLWTVLAIIGFGAYKYTEVSIRAPLSESRVLFSLAFGVI